MKKFLLTVLLSLGLFTTKAQTTEIADFSLDSPYTAATIGVRWQLIDSSQLASRCADEFGYVVGDNELAIFGLRVMNHGPYDFAFPYIVDANGNRISDSLLLSYGLHWDSCHHHVHIIDWGRVKLLNKCKEFIKDGGKIGWNMYDGTNVYSDYLNTVFGAPTAAWLSQYMVLDWALAGHEPNDEYNGTTRLGMSAGHGDIYPQSTWGNDIELHDVPNGEYWMRFILNASLYVNQGFNLAPDSFDVPVVLSGQYPGSRLNPRTLVPVSTPHVCCANPIPSIPTGVKFKGQDRLEWAAVQGATQYEIWQAKASQAPGEGWYVQDINSYRLIGVTSATTISIPPLGGKWAYRIKAKNCAGTSGFSSQVIR